MIYSLGRVMRRLFSIPGPGPHPRVAIAHDYLTQRGGAERVVLALHRAFPDAPIYTTLYSPSNTFPEFRDAQVHTSWLNRFRFFRRHHRAALPLLPFAASTLRVPADLTLISSTGWAHGFAVTGRSVVYCHSPARWLYLTAQYIGRDREGKIVDRILRALKPALLEWDRQAVHHAGQRYLANSSVVRDRILEVYGLQAPVVFPPHAVDTGDQRTPILGIEWEEEEFFLVVSRLLPYKNVHHAIEAARRSGKKLLVIGAGPMARELQAMAPENVAFAQGVSDAQMRWAYAHCQAVLAVSHEDFGITPLEGAAYGKPTIALRAGGFLDTLREGVTGTFIEDADPETIRRALEEFRAEDFEATTIREHAATFGEERFVAQLRAELEGWGLLPPEAVPSSGTGAGTEESGSEGAGRSAASSAAQSSARQGSGRQEARQQGAVRGRRRRRPWAQERASSSGPRALWSSSPGTR